MMIGNNVTTAVGLVATCSLMVLALLSTFPAVKAYEKGRSFAKWYVFSLLLFPAALAASFAIKPKNPEKA
jgi:hypothetical protein